MKIIDDVIYLDNAFIVEAYQKIKKIDAAVKYTKTTDVSVGVSAIAKAGASLKESFEYPINAHTMYKEITSELNKIEGLEYNDDSTSEIPDLFWFDGTLGITQITHQRGKSNERIYFTFAAHNQNRSKTFYLSTNNIYFSSGYDSILEQADAAAYGFSIEVKILLKFLGTTRYQPLAAPMIILKKGNKRKVEEL